MDPPMTSPRLLLSVALAFFVAGGAHATAISPNTDLSGTNHNGENHRFANGDNSDLSNASLVGTNLRDTSFLSTNFFSANLTNANLRDSNSSGANFANTNMTGTLMRDGDFTNAVFDGALMTGNVVGADFSGASIVGTDLSARPRRCVRRHAEPLIAPSATRAARSSFTSVTIASAWVVVE